MIRNLHITLRSAIAFGLLGFITLAVGVYCFIQTQSIGKLLFVYSDVRLPASVLIGEIRKDFMLNDAYLRSIIYEDATAERQQKLNSLQQLENSYIQNIRTLQPLFKTPESQALAQQIARAHEQYQQPRQQLLTLLQAGNTERAGQLYQSELVRLSNNVDQAIAALAQRINRMAETSSAEARTLLSSTSNMMIFVIILALVAVAILAVLFSRSIIQPLNRANELAQVIASGDLTQQLHDDSKDEAAELIASLGRMQQQLRDTIRSISDSSIQLATASEELSIVTSESSKTLHQQNAELEQGATAVNELTTAIDEVARSAAATSQESEQANTTTIHGAQQVKQTIATIDSLANEIGITRQGVEQLASRVKDIGSVLDVIRAIAEQTNLLALNAAIEAARAGESGRGFAVVADEVRALAHRTQESTKEIEKMMQLVQTDTDKAVSAMQQSNQRATDTLAIANNAGVALQEIAAAISQISDQNMTIASAAEEQATVAREVDRNLVNIRDLGLQTAAGANQTNASSAELAKLADQLKIMVQKFRL